MLPPETANQLKVEAIRRLGATVVLAGRNYNDAYLEAMRAAPYQAPLPSETPRTIFTSSIVS